MRRVLLFAAFLLLLGLTTATAASFDVQAEDITSFSTEVSLEMPPPPELYLVGTNRLTRPIEDKQLSAGVGTGEILEWSSDQLTNGLALSKKAIDLQIYTNGGASNFVATLHDCELPATPTTSDGCTQIASIGPENLPNATAIRRFTPLPSPYADIGAGRQLRLRITNATAPGTNSSFNVQWGKDEPGRDSKLIFSDAP